MQLYSLHRLVGTVSNGHVHLDGFSMVICLLDKSIRKELNVRETSITACVCMHVWEGGREGGEGRREGGEGRKREREGGRGGREKEGGDSKPLTPLSKLASTKSGCELSMNSLDTS